VEIAMNLDLKPELERRLNRLANEMSRPTCELVEEAITSYLDTVETDSSLWITGTQKDLSRVWSTEEFSDWAPPNGR
jgi:predicted DNA-binding protein